MYTHKLPVPVFMPAVILANYARKTYSINGVKSTRLASTVAHIYDIDPVWFDKPFQVLKILLKALDPSCALHLYEQSLSSHILWRQAKIVFDCFIFLLLAFNIPLTPEQNRIRKGLGNLCLIEIKCSKNPAELSIAIFQA